MAAKLVAEMVAEVAELGQEVRMVVERMVRFWLESEKSDNSLCQLMNFFCSGIEVELQKAAFQGTIV